MSIQGMGYCIGYILGTICHMGPPDYTPDYEKYAIKQKRKDKICDRRMESLYSKEVWEIIKNKRVAANIDRMLGR